MIKKMAYGAMGLFILGATPVLADGGPRVYAYTGVANYCPSGLQPISINGIICCGSPNQSVSYQAMQSRPLRRARRYVQSMPSCPVGTKGCN